MNVLVHACCAPCSIMPTKLLLDEGHDITVFYANGNIAPKAEYEKRLAELQTYGANQGFAVVEGAYNPEEWEERVAPIAEAVERGEADRRSRCRACYRMRLQQAAAAAAQEGYDALASTLAVSPYQFNDILEEELHRACEQVGIQAHFQDYRPYYDEATRISRQLGMYRQNYCGCRYSVVEAEQTRMRIKEQRAQEKAAKAAATAAQRAAEQEEHKRRVAEKQAYEQERARRRAILKQMRNAR